jgi:hypothetical protein
MMMKLVFFLSLISGAVAFAPLHSSLRLVTPVTTTTPTSLNVAAPPPLTETPPAPVKVPDSIDENVYTFNKVVIDSVYNIICFFYPVTGTKRDFARFYVLETVARVPYFAYLSVMHLRYVQTKRYRSEPIFIINFLNQPTFDNRETFGQRDLGEFMRTHYAESDNELHHLLIMESLGGNESPVDRVLAQTMAFGYYWYVVGGKYCFLYRFNPGLKKTILSQISLLEICVSSYT